MIMNNLLISFKMGFGKKLKKKLKKIEHKITKPVKKVSNENWDFKLESRWEIGGPGKSVRS